MLVGAAGDDPAVSWNEHTLTFAELRQASSALAAHLTAGDTVAIVVPNVPALPVALFAAWEAGAVAVPLSARLREHDLGAALVEAAPSVVVSIAGHGGFSPLALARTLAAEGRLPNVRLILVVDTSGAVTEQHATKATSVSVARGAEIGLLLFTSGTTGAPRAALVSHGRELAGAASFNEILGLNPSDVTVMVVPASHAFGLTCLLATIGGGGHAVLVDGTFSAEPMMSALRRWEATVLHGSPTLFTALAKASGGLPGTLRVGFVAGAPCPAPLIERLCAAEGFDLLNLYGMTETGAVAATRPADPPEPRRSSVGRPLPGYEVRARDGEVQVRSAYGPLGYTHGGLDLGDGGWLRTGDLGTVDDDGYLRIVGRQKDVAKVAGFTVVPAEVETVLLDHPDVLVAVVVPVAHDVLGESLRAYVVLTPGAATAAPQLLAHCRRRLAGYKLPYSLEVMVELPTLPSGKPDRAALSALAL